MYKIKYSNLNQNVGSINSNSKIIEFGDYKLFYDINYEYIFMKMFINFSRYIFTPIWFKNNFEQKKYTRSNKVFNISAELMPRVDNYFKFYSNSFDIIRVPSYNDYRNDLNLFEQTIGKFFKDISTQSDLEIIDDFIPLINELLDVINIKKKQNIFKKKRNSQINAIQAILFSDYQILKTYKDILTPTVIKNTQLFLYRNIVASNYNQEEYFNNEIEKIKKLVKKRNIIFEHLLKLDIIGITNIELPDNQSLPSTNLKDSTGNKSDQTNNNDSIREFSIVSNFPRKEAIDQNIGNEAVNKEETNKSLTLNDIFEVKNNKNIISNESVSKLDNQENLLVKNEDKKVENILKIVTNPQISQDDDDEDNEINSLDSIF
jgi:hypothetical protein